MKKHLPLLLLLTLICAFLWIAPSREDFAVYDRTLRLHVLAASDSEDDQARKLLVRDAVLKEASSLMEDCRTREEAEKAVSDAIPLLTQRAEEVLRDAGSTDPVRITLSEEYYPTRNYESVRLPAGTYHSLRVLIGEAEGKNWWCVLFPPLCTRSAEVRDDALAVSFTKSQIRLLTDAENPRYVLKFKLLEWIEGWLHA